MKDWVPALETLTEHDRRWLAGLAGIRPDQLDLPVYVRRIRQALGLPGGTAPAGVLDAAARLLYEALVPGRKQLPSGHALPGEIARLVAAWGPPHGPWPDPDSLYARLTEEGRRALLSPGYPPVIQSTAAFLATVIWSEADRSQSVWPVVEREGDVSRYRVAIDSGGTFTDVIVEDRGTGTIQGLSLLRFGDALPCQLADVLLLRLITL